MVNSAIPPHQPFDNESMPDDVERPGAPLVPFEPAPAR
jgi:hypothetical protein